MYDSSKTTATVWPLLLCITALSVWSSGLMEVTSLGVRTRTNALDQFEDIRCTKHGGCRELINEKKTEGTRLTANNFQVTYYCRCGNSCLVVCEACAVLCKTQRIVYEASSNVIESKALTNNKRNHQRYKVNAQIHEQYTELLKTRALQALQADDNDSDVFNEQDFDDHEHVDVNSNAWIPLYKVGDSVFHDGEVGTISSVDIVQQMYSVTFCSSAARINESSLTYCQFNQIIPDNVLQMYNTSKCLPGDPDLHHEKLPSTKVPPQHMNDFDGFNLVHAGEDPEPVQSDPSFQRKYGVKTAALDNANFNKPGVFGSTAILREQLKNYIELGPDKVFEHAVRKTYDFNGEITEKQLAYQMALYKLAEKLPVSQYQTLASALKKQEENVVSIAVKATITGMEDRLYTSGLSDASKYIGETKEHMMQDLINDLLAELHPSNGEVRNIRNGSGVAQIGADLRRLVANVRAATPVAPYTMLDPYIAGAKLQDIVAIAFAQLNLNINAIVPDQCPANVTSLYESKSVVDGKTEWVPSCVYWNRGGWESFPVERMPEVLEKGYDYQQNQNPEDAIFTFVHDSDIFAPIETNDVETQWMIDFADRTVLITTGNTSVLCPLLFGVHYCVEACLATWFDGARAADVREHTKQLESAILSMCINGRHVFRHDTVWCFLLTLDTRYDKRFFSTYIDEQLKEFNKYGGRMVYSNAMKNPIILRIRYITGAYDRPQRMLEGGTTSGQPSARYGRIEGLLYDVNDVNCTLAILNSNFHIDRILSNYSHLFKRMDIPLAIEQCKLAFISSVSDVKPHSFKTIQETVQQYGPNKRTLLALFNATQTCKYCVIICMHTDTMILMILMCLFSLLFVFRL